MRFVCLYKDNLFLTSTVSCDAATQLHQTDHWCIAQHLQVASDGTVDKVAIYLIAQSPANSCCRSGMYQSSLKPLKT